MLPDVSLVASTVADQPTLANLMQLYAYEFSDLLDLDVAENGLFPQRDLGGFFSDPLRRVFFIRKSGKLAGFAIIDHRSRLSDEQGVLDMAEFFVLRRYRGQGVGARAAGLAFDTFRGKWEVRQVPKNTAATAFWRKVIGRYTGGRFVESILDDDDKRWRGTVQTFHNTELSLGTAQNC
jgi:predicted acetyltransferase